jgi:hypothetical protein
MPTLETTGLINLVWTSPTGQTLPLMSEGEGVHVLSGIDGLGAAPRVLTLQPLATGGSVARWSHVDQRLITLPLHLQAANNQELVALRREVVSAFLSTTPAAGVPAAGTLRVTRSDSTWREIQAVYMDGLSGADETTLSPTVDRAVLQLVCPDPWWYGDREVAAEFTDATVDRNYLSPYETISTGRTLGAVLVEVSSDAAVSPVWTITGPAQSVTVRYATAGPGWTYGSIAAGRSVTIDVEKYTVTDDTGASRIDNIAWPSSSLFQLNPGNNNLLVSITGGQDATSAVRLAYRPRWEAA